MMSSGLIPKFAVCTVLCAAIALAPTIVSAAEITGQQAQQMVEKTYGVRVLKITRDTLHGKPIFLLTVLTPGGNDNAAFQVNRLALDPVTGKLVSGFRHRSSGYDYATGAGARDDNRQSTDVLRRGWNWR